MSTESMETKCCCNCHERNTQKCKACGGLVPAGRYRKYCSGECSYRVNSLRSSLRYHKEKGTKKRVLECNDLEDKNINAKRARLFEMEQTIGQMSDEVRHNLEQYLVVNVQQEEKTLSMPVPKLKREIAIVH